MNKHCIFFILTLLFFFNTSRGQSVKNDSLSKVHYGFFAKLNTAHRLNSKDIFSNRNSPFVNTLNPSSFLGYSIGAMMTYKSMDIYAGFSGLGTFFSKLGDPGPGGNTAYGLNVGYKWNFFNKSYVRPFIQYDADIFKLSPSVDYNGPDGHHTNSYTFICNLIDIGFDFRLSKRTTFLYFDYGMGPAIVIDNTGHESATEILRKFSFGLHFKF